MGCASASSLFGGSEVGFQWCFFVALQVKHDPPTHPTGQHGLLHVEGVALALALALTLALALLLLLLFLPPL